MLYSSGWSPDKVIPVHLFAFCIPLSMLLGFAEDYKKIIVNARHELILVRGRSDNNVVQTSAKAFTLKLYKVQWRMPHVSVADPERLSLLNLVSSGKSIYVSFRSWDLYEYPSLPKTNHHIWTVKTSTQLEKPRFVILALQTGKNNQAKEDVTSFDFCKLTDVKVHLNSDTYPYDDLNVNFERDKYSLLYNMYAKFQESYYGKQSNPLLTWSDFKTKAPIAVIDCSHQNEAIKTGPVDVKIEFKTSENIPDNTTAYCLLLHDRLIEYVPLTNIVKRVI